MEERYQNRTLKIAELLPAVAGKILGKTGLNIGSLLVNWTTIVDKDTAQYAVPIKIKFAPRKRTEGVLYISCSSAYALELIHQETQIIQRINAFLGYNAVNKLRIMQNRRKI